MPWRKIPHRPLFGIVSRMSFWFDSNSAFSDASQSQASALVAEHGAALAYEEARRRRIALPPGEAQVFAYNVELLVAEAGGIATGDARAAPLGPEAPIWFVPFLTPELIGWALKLMRGLFTQIKVRAAPLVTTRLPARQAQNSPTILGLKARQIECLKWVAEGKSSTDIAAIIGKSPRTVDHHLENACRALNVRTRTQAVRVAAEAGLFERT